jgi:hypothetical protein
MDSIEKIERRLNAIEKRLAVLEGNHGLNGEEGDKILEMDLTLPEADINGLHFNEMKVHAVFEKQDDGWYHSRDILFISARDTDEGTGRDILSEYLDSDAVKEAFCACLDTDTKSNFPSIKIALPEKGQDIKKYNGVTCGYWLAPPYASNNGSFCIVHTNGTVSSLGASSTWGVAPCFCIS